VDNSAEDASLPDEFRDRRTWQAACLTTNILAIFGLCLETFLYCYVNKNKRGSR
jgi:hypothetical protein